MADLTTQEIVDAYNQDSDSDIGASQIEFHEKYGLKHLIPYYIEAFPKINKWYGRKIILFYLCRYAKDCPDIVKLARYALNDKSWKVRSDACGILSYSLDEESLPLLHNLENHKDLKSREDIKATINAINNKNHHLFVDRNNEGKYFWDPGLK